MANQTTERYEANKHCEFDCFDLTLEDIYQYGCEFEFYINKSLDFKSTIIEIKDKIYQFWLSLHKGTKSDKRFKSSLIL